MGKPRNIESIHPLSPMQSGMLFHTLHEPGSGIYHEQVIYRLEGEIDPRAMENAWRAVAARHAALRTLFTWEKRKKPLQVVRKRVDLPWEDLDWRGVDPGEREERLEAYLSRDREKGFALQKAPLMRLALIRWGEDAWRFIWSHHHILMDGWCVPIIFKEVIGHYEAFRAGRSFRPPPARPYGEYIAWLQRRDASSSKKYWQKALQGLDGPTPLPFDGGPGRTSPGSALFNREEMVLPGAATRDLETLARTRRLTVNAVFQTAWAVVLGGLGRLADVVFGSVVSGRPARLPGVETMIGLFINTLPVRVNLSPDRTFRTAARELLESQAEREAFGYIPLSDIRAASGLEPGAPLFESIVAFENYPVDKTLADRETGVRIVDARIVEKTNYPLNLMVSPGAETRVAILHDGARFEKENIRRLLDCLRTVLEAATADPDRRLAEIPLAPEDGSGRIPPPLDENVMDCPREAMVHELFRQCAETHPDRTAAACNGERIAYGELNEKADRLARRLRRLGVGPETAAGVLLERSIEMVAAVLAVLKAGGAYVLLDPAHPRGRISHILEDSGVRVLVTRKRFAGKWSGEFIHPVAPDEEPDPPPVRDGEEGERPAPSGSPRSPAYIIHTSGTTGRPKGVVVAHESLTNLLYAFERVAPSGETLVGTSVCSVAFDVFAWEMFSTLCFGGALHIVPGADYSDPARFARFLVDRRATSAYIPPGLLEAAVEALQNAPGPISLDRILVGVEPIPRGVLQRLRDLSDDLRVVNGYGPSETTICAAFFPFVSGMEEPERRTPIGKAAAEYRIHILDEHLRRLPPGAPGEIHIAGIGLARGYLNHPALTARAFIPDPFAVRPGERLYKTGDLARYLPDGNIEFLGREDHQVKIRGYRVETAEIEHVLLEHPGVREAVVTAPAGRTGGRRLAAHVAAEKRAFADRPASVARLRDHLAGSLPDYMIPADFVFLDKLPRTANGKVDRAALRAPDPSTRVRADAFVSPGTDVEKRLGAIWADVLNLDRVGIHDNFFELGGDSILSIQILSRASREGLTFTLKQFFQHPTIARLAPLASAAPPREARDASDPEAAPLTPVQRWFFEMDMPEPHHFNQTLLLKTSPDAAPDALEKIIGRLVDHHDALRSRFVKTGEEMRQERREPQAGPLLIVEDLSPVPPSDRTARLEAMAAAYQASLDPARGRLARFVWFRMGDGRSDRLLIVVHHLVVDGVSWRILMEDLHVAHEQLARGEPIRLPPKTDSFARWAERLVEHADSEALRKEADFWLNQGASVPPPLPRDAPPDRKDAAEAPHETILAVLDRENTSALLREAHGAYNTRINDLLLAALALAFRRWTGEASLLVEMEGHGREELFPDMDLSRTVGWFTSLYPLVLTVEGGENPGPDLIAVKERLRGIPNNGVGHGILAHLTRDPGIRDRIRALPRPEIGFNYLGRFDGMLSRPPVLGQAPESPGPEVAPSTKRIHRIDVNGLIAGDRLRTAWTFDRGVHRKETIESLARDYRTTLETLVAHCLSPGAGEPTASDFPGSRLDQETLEDFMEDLDI